MNPLTLLTWGKRLLPVLLIALAAWWLVTALERAEERGWQRRDATAQKEAAQAAEERAAERLQNTLDAAARDARLEIELADLAENAAARQLELSAHLAQQAKIPYQPRKIAHEKGTTESAPAPSDGHDRPLLGQSVLDEWTVRLLDDARANRPADTANGGAARASDAEGPAAAALAPITGAEFASNDLEVVRLYHDLAQRHNELVDWAKAQCLAPDNQPTAP